MQQVKTGKGQAIRIILLLAVAVSLAGALWVRHKGGKPWTVYALYPHDVLFVGYATSDKAHAPVQYFRLSVRDKIEGLDLVTDIPPISTNCPVTIHWQGAAYPLATLTPQAMTAMKCHVLSRRPESTCYKLATEEGDDYFGIWFTFKGDRLVKLSASYELEHASPCPYQLSQADHSPVTWPLTHAQLVATFGEPLAVYRIEPKDGLNNACRHTLSRLSKAKEAWAAQNQAPDGTAVSLDDMRHHTDVELSCPYGGQLTPNPIGTYPECSLPFYH